MFQICYQIGATLPFCFFDYEKEAMRRIVVANSLARYDDRHFVSARQEFNRWRMQNGFTLVEQSSMKSWCAYDRKCARDVASNEPFACPTTSMVTRCFRLQCRGFVDELGDARLNESVKQHLHYLGILAAASDEQLQRIVELFVTDIVSLRLAAMKRSKRSSVQQLCVLRLFEDTLLRNYDHSFRVAFESCLQEQFDMAPPPRSSYEHIVQLFWNAFGTAVHFRRIEHEPESNFDIGASLGDMSGDVGEYVRFSELEMTTLYYLLGVSGSKIFSLFARWMSDDGSDDYSVVASGIYGNPGIMKQYKYAQKNVANQSHGVSAGTLCWPPVDLFIRCLAIARAVFSPPLSSIEACARLVATVGSKEFIQQCYKLIEEYGQLAFGERMQEASFHDVYSRMMFRLCAHYARLLARVRSQQTARRLVKPSTDVIAQSAVGLDSAKPLSTKSVLTAVGACSIRKQ